MENLKELLLVLRFIRESLESTAGLLLHSFRPSQYFDHINSTNDRISKTNGYKMWIVLHFGAVLLSIFAVVMLRIVDINLIFSKYLKFSFAILAILTVSVLNLFLWLIIFYTFLEVDSRRYGKLVLMTSIYYGPMFFFIMIIFLLFGTYHFKNTFNISVLYKGGDFPLWELILFSLRQSYLDPWISSLGIVLQISWCATYLICSAAFCMKVAAVFSISDDKINRAMVLTSVSWVIVTVPISLYISIPLLSLIV